VVSVAAKAAERKAEWTVGGVWRNRNHSPHLRFTSICKPPEIPASACNHGCVCVVHPVAEMRAHLSIAMKRPIALLGFLCASALTAGAALDADKPALPPEKPDASGTEFFEKKIRPVLSDKCYKCHSAQADKVKGGLLLDTREGIRRGGDSGPAVVPGNLKESLIIEALHYQNKDFAMPPKKEGGKLPDDVIKDFEKWVNMGAPDPREETAPGTAAKVAEKKYDYGEAKKWWAWQAPVKSAPPTVKDTAWPHNDIDRFLLAAMEAKGVKPVGDADKLTLIRRLYYDLVGVPPTIGEVKAFIDDKSPNAYEKVVDKLLATPAFGERWGRHWLDVARYAESTGKDVNAAFPHAWRYRDYVIDAFNADKPYNEFLREQVAGDLLPAKSDKEKAEHLVATGFLAMGTKGLNEQNPRQFVLDLADEQVDTLSQAVLGMTVACARCHDHKFDPIPQRDYYALAGIFTSTDTRYGTAGSVQNRHAAELIELPKDAGVPVAGKVLTAAQIAQKKQELDAAQEDLKQAVAERMQQGRAAQQNGATPAAGAKEADRQRQQVKRLRDLAESGMLEAELKAHEEDGQPKALAMGTQDLPPYTGGGGFFGGRRGMGRGGLGFGGFGRGRGRPPEFANINDCALYTRGDVDKPSDKVPRGFPAIVTLSSTPSIPYNQSGRLQLADWLTSGNNPMTARVMTNRVWKWLFGEGIVTSTDNFGTTGNKPSNQALLDTLAVEFQNKGWSVKGLIREIVLSHAYQLSSAHEDGDFRIDPENSLVWHMNKRRLDAECIRDAMLAVSGNLDYTRPVGDLIAQNGDGAIAGNRRFSGLSEESIASADRKTNVRSVYLPVPRDVLPDSLAVFDYADTGLVTGSRETTNVPSQALFMLNSEFVDVQSKKLAAKIMTAYPTGPNGGVGARLDERVTYAYWLVLSRAPDEAERRAVQDFLMKFPAAWKNGDGRSMTVVRDGEATNAAWATLCRALFSSAEFRYLN